MTGVFHYHEKHNLQRASSVKSHLFLLRPPFLFPAPSSPPLSHIHLHWNPNVPRWKAICSHEIRNHAWLGLMKKNIAVDKLHWPKCIIIWTKTSASANLSCRVAHQTPGNQMCHSLTPPSSLGVCCPGVKPAGCDIEALLLLRLKILTEHAFKVKRMSTLHEERI